MLFRSHICLTSSIAWGFFSILLVRFIHPPVGRLLARVPALVVDPAALALTAAFTADLVCSVQAALDLRDVLTRLTEENEELRRLARRAEVAAAFAGDDLRKFRERTEVEKLLLQSRVQEELQDLRQARARRAERRQAAWEEALRRRAQVKLEVLEAIAEALETCREHLDSLPGLTEEALAEHRADLEDAVGRLRRREAVIRTREPRSYRRSLRILRGNPSAMARDFGDALEALRELTGRK